ncbi:MAG: hypothetical protein MUF10_17295 [Thermoanaerobaculaceae bacterium]|nr:hypothetical protein [Thermoanaerobaculaceae bacterium]
MARFRGQVHKFTVDDKGALAVQIDMLATAENAAALVPLAGAKATIAIWPEQGALDLTDDQYQPESTVAQLDDYQVRWLELGRLQEWADERHMIVSYPCAAHSTYQVVREVGKELEILGEGVTRYDALQAAHDAYYPEPEEEAVEVEALEETFAEEAQAMLGAAQEGAQAEPEGKPLMDVLSQ